MKFEQVKLISIKMKYKLHILQSNRIKQCRDAKFRVSLSP